MVSADRLIDDLWGAATPQQPGNALQIVVSKVRRALGAELIETRPPPQVRAPAVTWAGLGLLAGHAGAAARHVDEAIDLSERAADHTSLGLAWTVSSRLGLLEGRADLAAERLDRAP